MRFPLGCVFLFLFLSAQPSSALTDYQLRLLLHGQSVQEDEQGVGWAMWTTVPDVTGKSFRVLAVTGPMWRSENLWIEVMGGMFANSEGLLDPVINVRSVAKFGRVSLYTEELYAFRPRRLVLQPNLMVKVSKRFGIGIGSDILLHTGENDVGIGLRGSFAISKRITFGQDCQFHWQGGYIVARSYLGALF